MITVDFNKLNIQPGFKILDIGCGSGRHTCAAHQFKNVTVLGADISIRDLVEAKNRLNLHDRLGQHGGGIWGLSVADLTCLPLKNNYFDLVIASEVMEHIPAHQTAAKELMRVLKPGGMLVVSVPRYWPERICWALSENYSNASNGHIRIYKSKELVELLESFGLKKRAMHYAHSLHTPFWWLKCLIGPSREDSRLVNLYHRFLTWDLMKKPRGTRFLENLLNPMLGKSVVGYLRKEKALC